MTARIRVGRLALAYLALGWVVVGADIVMHGPLLRNAFALFCMLVASAIAAGADTPLGLLNFVVLQWFGVRLARSRLVVEGVAGFQPGERVVYHSRITGKRYRCRVVDEKTLQFWALLRWVWPLTGWWSDYRWIARRR